MVVSNSWAGKSVIFWMVLIGWMAHNFNELIPVFLGMGEGFFNYFGSGVVGVKESVESVGGFEMILLKSF